MHAKKAILPMAIRIGRIPQCSAQFYQHCPVAVLENWLFHPNAKDDFLFAAGGAAARQPPLLQARLNQFRGSR